MIHLPDPELQVEFAASLATIRNLFLQDALSEAIRKIEIPDLDKELAIYVPAHSLSALAGHGLRGELMFPVPIVLIANPKLLGYYRLLYGYSKKEFYTSASGVGLFKGMEEKGRMTVRHFEQLPTLCSAVCGAGAVLLAGIGSTRISVSLLDDLSLLTLGPQLRGGANVKRGTAGIRTVFNIIQDIVQTAIVRASEMRIEVATAAGRRVFIEFAPDPDIVIKEEMRNDSFLKVAIEVKAGRDFSNIHNRLGEAEKSHQKARALGFAECWTIVNVDNVDMALAHRESPTTNRFYRISDLISAQGHDYEDFRDRLLSLVGISGL